jgi:hypothetical protein
MVDSAAEYLYKFERLSPAGAGRSRRRRGIEPMFARADWC